jgi:hypothetical protein
LGRNAEIVRMTTKRQIQLGIATLVATMLFAGPSAAAIKNLNPVKDTTIFSESGSESDGAGLTFFAGRIGSNGNGALRRALIEFDLSKLPANAVIESVSLALWRTSRNPQAAGPTTPMSLHKVLKDWGEAGSSAGNGSGAPAQLGDATWRYTSFNTAEWSTLGGDFVSSASATAIVGAPEAVYTWTSSGLAADVQSWVNGGAGNFGWILIGDEQNTSSVREFISRNSADISMWPGLTITYTQAVPEPATVAMLLAGLALLLGLNRKRFV